MKDLAVLIPVYNDQAGLDRTLDSIRETDNSFTVFIIDDGSKREITVDRERYPFSVELLRTDQNGGISKSLNIGLETIRSRGFKFLARLDAADLNRPNRFSQQYHYLGQHENVCLLGSNAVFRDEDDEKELFTTNLPLESGKIRKWMVFRNCFIHPTVMLRIEGISGADRYGEDYPHIEDYAFFSRIVERYHCENLEKPLVDCFVRDAGISVKHHKEQLLSGLRYRWDHPKFFNLLWYAYFAKRLSYFLIPFQVRNRVKDRLGFVRTPSPETGPTNHRLENSRVTMTQSNSH